MAYMNDQNTQDKITAQAEIAEKKADEIISTVEHSKLSKNLPTEIQSVNITDILKLIIISEFCNFLPLFLMFSMESNSKINFLRKILNFSFIVLYLVSFSMILACYISGLSMIYKYLLFALAAKCAVTTVLLIFQLPKSMLYYLVGLLYIIFFISQDFAILYYLGIYIKRLASNQYDEYGVKIIEKKEEKV